VNSLIRSFARARASAPIIAPHAAGDPTTTSLPNWGTSSKKADESVYWLELITAAKTIDDPDLAPMLAEANELLAIFNQSQLTARTNQAARRVAKKSQSNNRQSTSKSPNS
jgi:hypothetical protein